MSIHLLTLTYEGGAGLQAKCIRVGLPYVLISMCSSKFLSYQSTEIPPEILKNTY